ncbi:MAG TPA: ABC transporter ATP-binding protein [Planctomycetaceae bacterium]|nr:ABC transporter ATP-binding protein [Planctomycetaceae bacterium]
MTSPDHCPRTVLEIHHLSYRYAGGCRALDDVSFSVTHGEVVGLVGPSGAGKSTLLMHLNGLLPDRRELRHRRSESPSVIVDGIPVRDETLPDVRRKVGFLFQDPDDQLFCPTVEEDVAFGPLHLDLPRDEVRRRVRESLAAVGLSGYEARSTVRLSVGERKRVCLAGVFACKPTLLALDEPFSNLDPRSRKALIAILREFPGAQIIATHDLDLIVAVCSRVILLDEGRIQADGPARQILADRKLVEEHGLEIPLCLRRTCEH